MIYVSYSFVVLEHLRFIFICSSLITSARTCPWVGSEIKSEKDQASVNDLKVIEVNVCIAFCEQAYWTSAHVVLIISL